MHTLILGMTESGKSTLAKILSRQLKAVGKVVVVLDPLADTGWEATEVVDSPERFGAYLRANRSVYGIVDEGGEVFNEGYNREYDWWATRSRHYGHSVAFVTQRGIQIPRTMRDQTNRLYLFTSSKSDGKL